MTIRREILDFNAQVKTEAHARLVDRNHRIVDAGVYGFSHRDRLEMTRLLATPERRLGARRIDEIFSEHFFSTNFWQMWRTTFAFQNWHSRDRAEALHAALHPGISAHAHAVGRPPHQVQPVRLRSPGRSSAGLPLKGVDVRFGARVVDVDFDQSDPDRPPGHAPASANPGRRVDDRARAATTSRC